MWAHYRKTMFPIQFLIIAMCAVLLVALHLPVSGVLFLFCVMELGALIGAAWAARLKRRLDPNRLPLQR